jgi:hypothetical protein
MPSGPVVDTLTAQDFLAEALTRASADDLRTVGAELRAKSEAMRRIVGDTPAALDREGLTALLRWSFTTRRHAAEVIDSVGVESLAAAIGDLLGSGDAVDARVRRFAAAVPTPRAFDLPGELLHFTAPDAYWLWTRWMWDPENDTGALRLVTLEEVDLVGDDPGATYLLVGRALAFVEETGKARGFTALAEGLYGTDVFLASVYAVYLHTVLGMRMTREFTRLAPPVTELVRRLLGVHAIVPVQEG